MGTPLEVHGSTHDGKLLGSLSFLDESVRNSQSEGARIMIRNTIVAGLATLAFFCWLGCSSDSTDGGTAPAAGGSAGSGGGAGGTKECGPGSPAPKAAVASCNHPTTKHCDDYTGSSWSEPGLAKNICGSAEYADAPCATANVTGSCQQHCGSSSEVVIRYYDTSSDWKAMCEGQLEGKWIAP
jgi:hypothetical protein